jgi:hypothetical protein
VEPVVGAAVPEASRRLRLVSHLGAFGWCLLVAVYATWPLATHAGTHVMGNLGDPLEVAWRFAWAAHGVIHAPLHLFDANIFHPEPLTFAYSENHLGVSLPLAPVFWLGGNAILGYNLAILVVLAAGGFGVYLLTYRLTGSRGASLVAGTAYTAAPFRISMAALGHVHVLALHVLPLVLLVLLRLRRDPSRRLLVALALLVALSWWSSLTGAFMTMVAIATWGLWELRLGRRAWPAIWRAALATGAGVLLSVPVLWPYAEVRQLHPEYQHPDSEVLALSATPGTYLFPPPGGRLIRPAYRELSNRFAPAAAAAEKELFPGFVLLGACGATGAGGLYAVARRRIGSSRLRGTGPAGLVATLGVVALVLSFGPRYGARPDGAPLPFQALDTLAGGLMRAPARLGALVVMTMAVLAGVGLSWLSPPRRRVLVPAALALLLLEFMPIRISLVEAPARTRAHLAVARQPGAVLGLPTVELDAAGYRINPSLPRESVHMFLSTVHWRPLTNGWAAYFPPQTDAFARAVADLPSAGGFQALRARGVRTVVVQTELLAGTPWEGVTDRLARWPGVRSIARSPGVRVFDVTAATRDIP